MTAVCELTLLMTAVCALTLVTEGCANSMHRHYISHHFQSGAAADSSVCELTLLMTVVCELTLLMTAVCALTLLTEGCANSVPGPPSNLHC